MAAAAVFLFLVPALASASDILISLQGKVNYNGAAVNGGNLSATIYNAATGGTLLYSDTFLYAINNSFFDVMLGAAAPLNLSYGENYWLGISVNGQGISWGGSSRLKFYSSVGNTSSGFKLSSSGSNTLLNATNGTVNAGLYAGMLSGGQAGASIGTNSNHQFRLFTNGADALTVDTNGNVGIGTANPGALLHMYKSGSADGILLIESATTGDAGSFLKTQNNAGSYVLFGKMSSLASATVYGGTNTTVIGSDNSPIAFFVGGYGVANEKMRITNGGNVGINTTSPVNTLNVVGDANITGDFLYGCPNTATNQMVKVGSFCIDKYEAYTVSGSLGNANGNNTNAVAGSKAGVAPQASITWFQAQQACLNAGKRLCTNAEWQGAVAGTPDPGADGGASGCNVASSGTPANTGAHSACVSRWGAYDMVGNVWEWVADWGQAGAISQATYVAWSDGTAVSPWPADYGSDNTWNVNGRAYNGVAWTSGAPAAFIRGGHWGDGADAGSFALYLDNAPSLSDAGIGFRCCK